MNDRYVLCNSATPDTQVTAYWQFAEGFLLDQGRQLDTYLKLPPEQRSQAARSNPFLGAVSAQHERMVGFHSFLSGLTEGDLKNIVRGRPLDIPISQLGVAQREFIVSEYRQANLLGRPGVPQPEQLDRLTLFRGPAEMPTIHLNIGAVGGHGVLGGVWMERALQERGKRSWLAAGEDQNPPTEAASAADSPVFAPETARTPATGAPSGINLLAERLPGAPGVDLDEIQPPLARALETCSTRGVYWKRWEDFLLFRPGGWQAADRGSFVPWPTLKKLTASAQAGAGYLNPNDWLALADLRRDQLSYLSNEFPDAREIAALQPILQLVRGMSPRERGLLSQKEAAKWSDLSVVSRQKLAVLIPGQQQARFRLRVRWNTQTVPPTLQFYAGSNDPEAGMMEIKFRRCRTWDDEHERFVEMAM